jgi:type III secretory pathway component EscR
MSTQQETRSSSGTAIDNLTYDLITVIQEKSKGLEAYQQYLQDAQSNQQCKQLFQQIQQQDQQAVQSLLGCLHDVMHNSSGGSQ